MFVCFLRFFSPQSSTDCDKFHPKDGGPWVWSEKNTRSRCFKETSESETPAATKRASKIEQTLLETSEDSPKKLGNLNSLRFLMLFVFQNHHFCTSWICFDGDFLRTHFHGKSPLFTTIWVKKHVIFQHLELGISKIPNHNREQMSKPPKVSISTSYIV